MKITCPNADCLQKIEIEPEHAGLVVPCPSCGEEMQLPGLSEFEAEATALTGEGQLSPQGGQERDRPVPGPCKKCGTKTSNLYPYAAVGLASSIVDVSDNATVYEKPIRCKDSSDNECCLLNAYEYICHGCTAKRRFLNGIFAVGGSVLLFAFFVGLSLGILALCNWAELGEGISKIAFGIVWLAGLGSSWEVLKNGWSNPGSDLAQQFNREHLSEVGYTDFYVTHLDEDRVSHTATTPPAPKLLPDELRRQARRDGLIGVLVGGAICAACLWLAFSWKVAGGWHWTFLGGAIVGGLVLVLSAVVVIHNRRAGNGGSTDS